MIYQSQPAQIDLPGQSWPEWFLDVIGKHADKVALIEGETGREITFRELRANIHSLACALKANGLQAGDVMAIYASNSPEYVVAFQAGLLAGAVVTTANPQYTASELGHQLEHAGTVCLLTDANLLDKATEAITGLSVKFTYLLDPALALPADCQFADATVGALMADHIGQTCPSLSVNPQTTLAVMPYSSGTTGLPKGVMLSHSNILVNCLQMEEQAAVTGPEMGDRVMGVLPLFHIFGMTVNMNTGLSKGATLITMRRFEPRLFLTLVQTYKINIAYVVPPIVLFLANDPSVADYDISSLEYMMSGAAPLAKDQIDSCSVQIDCAIYQGYGLTEASPVTHREPDQVPERRAGTIGVLVPGTEAMVVDVDSGQPVPPGETGELIVRGPQVMMGYFNDEQATRQTIDADGWLHTGDIAQVDEEGFFYVVDRLKELIKYKGYQVAPAELEGLLLTHPDIRDVAVVPQPDEQAGEIPRAVVVLADGAQATAEQIMTWVESRVAPFKKIRAVSFAGEIPKSPSGKILRRLLK